MKSLLLTFALCVVVTQCAHATPQVNDTIVIDGNVYGIFQFPMSGYWRYDDEPAGERLPSPDFEVTSSANWRGYVAQFSVDRGQLYLDSIRGRLNGKDVADREIIDKRFPIRAHWYSGSIFVSIGGFDKMTNKFRYVIEFEIERGKVVATRYSDLSAIPMTWNGLTRSQETKAATEP